MKERAKNRTVRDYYEHEILLKCYIQLFSKNIRFIDNTSIEECTQKQILKKYVEEFGHNPITEHRKDVYDRKRKHILKNQLYIVYCNKSTNLYFELSTLGYDYIRKKIGSDREIIYSGPVDDRKHYLAVTNKYSHLKRGGVRSTAFSLTKELERDIENGTVEDILPEHIPSEKQIKNDFFKQRAMQNERNDKKLNKAS